MALGTALPPTQPRPAGGSGFRGSALTPGPLNAAQQGLSGLAAFKAQGQYRPTRPNLAAQQGLSGLDAFKANAVTTGPNNLAMAFGKPVPRQPVTFGRLTNPIIDRYNSLVQENAPMFNQFADQFSDIAFQREIAGTQSALGRQRIGTDLGFAQEAAALERARLQAQHGGLNDRLAYLAQLEQFANRGYGLTNRELDVGEKVAGQQRDAARSDHKSDLAATGAWTSGWRDEGYGRIEDSYSAQMESIGINREQAMLALDREMAAIADQRNAVGRERKSIAHALANVGLNERQATEAARRAMEDLGISDLITDRELKRIFNATQGAEFDFAQTLINEAATREKLWPSNPNPTLTQAPRGMTPQAALNKYR